MIILKTVSGLLKTWFVSDKDVLYFDIFVALFKVLMRRTKSNKKKTWKGSIEYRDAY